MNLDSNSWNERYISKNTSWDAGIITQPLKEYFDQLNSKNIKILIPGCGNSHEAEYLIKLGFKNVTIVDFSEKALKNFKIRVSDFPDEQMICDDFFNIDGNFDLIIEQTFFCAIATDKRNKYAKKVHSLLNTNGKLVGLMFNAPMYSDHPPFGGSVKEYKSYFSSLFNYKCFEPAYNSISSRNGKELFVNLIKK
ncbi:methyltransferase domain-containing protein [Flavobacteriales bacterium]|nr:TPMT family class I SAM-dependent methyltransferase [Flavobacteriales bacterium]MDC1063620.1 methyltransferase domain-containing protein [Flavobacteriales bacterium]